jgi:aspartate carbamoyltransferase catalytic subunit
MRHLLSAADLDRSEALLVLDTAEQMAQTQQREIKKLPTLRGRTVVNLFFEDSTRTRISFEAAAKRLSADVINFSAKGSSVSKGESLKDTALTLQAMGADAVVVRHHLVGGCVAGAATGSVLAGRKVVFVGDILHCRVARSNVLLLHTLGAQVTLVAPPTLLPVGVGAWPCATSYDLDDALDGTDVVMMLRVQRERMNAAYFPSAREYSRRYGLDSRRLGLLPDHAIVMHPGPMNRGLEISAEAADCARSTVVEQVGNGVSVRMAVLYLLLAGGPPEAASPEAADRELVGVAK